jgi:hypothetical protein
MAHHKGKIKIYSPLTTRGVGGVGRPSWYDRQEGLIPSKQAFNVQNVYMNWFWGVYRKNIKNIIHTTIPPARWPVIKD